MVVGYKRVSALDQADLRQLDGVKTDKMFTDKASGKDTNRPQLTAMLGFVREGDTIVCHAMDRLARNLDDLRKLVLDLVSRGVHVRFVKESLTFTGEDSPMAHLLLSVIGAVAQFERDLIRERQREGIALAKQRKVYLGRAPSLSAAQADDLRQRVRGGEGKALLAREFGISRTTVYEYLGREVSDASLCSGLDGSELEGEVIGGEYCDAEVRCRARRGRDKSQSRSMQFDLHRQN